MATATAAETNPMVETQQDHNSANQQNGPIFIDTQHDDMVHDAQLDYYGCKLATSSSDRTVKIYDVSGSTYTHTATLQGHEGPVWEVSWAHPRFGVVLASCSFDGSVLLHRERAPGDWMLLSANRNLHDSSVNSVAFAPHEYGLIVAAASSDGYVSVLRHNEDDTWNIDKFCDNSLGVNAVSWAPYNLDPDVGDDGKNEVIGGDVTEGKHLCLRLVTAGCDNRIRFWICDVDGKWKEDPGAILGKGVSHMDWVRDVAWAPTSLSSQNLVASCSEDGSVIIWIRSDGGVWQPRLLNRFDGPVWRLSWSITGNILSVSSGDGDVTLWKQQLDGEWNKVSTIEDIAGESKGDSSLMQQQM